VYDIGFFTLFKVRAYLSICHSVNTEDIVSHSRTDWAKPITSHGMLTTVPCGIHVASIITEQY